MKTQNDDTFPPPGFKVSWWRKKWFGLIGVLLRATGLFDVMEAWAKAITEGEIQQSIYDAVDGLDVTNRLGTLQMMCEGNAAELETKTVAFTNLLNKHGDELITQLTRINIHRLEINQTMDRVAMLQAAVQQLQAKK